LSKNECSNVELDCCELGVGIAHFFLGKAYFPSKLEKMQGLECRFLYVFLCADLRFVISLPRSCYAFPMPKYWKTTPSAKIYATHFFLSAWSFSYIFLTSCQLSVDRTSDSRRAFLKQKSGSLKKNSDYTWHLLLLSSHCIFFFNSKLCLGVSYLLYVCCTGHSCFHAGITYDYKEA